MRRCVPLIPFSSALRLHDHKFIKWTMVRVKGSTSTGEAATAYLVPKGVPISTLADAEAMTQEAKGLVEAINASS